jgi:hypothetical protein
MYTKIKSLIFDDYILDAGEILIYPDGLNLVFELPVISKGNEAALEQLKKSFFSGILVDATIKNNNDRYSSVMFVNSIEFEDDYCMVRLITAGKMTVYRN